MNKKKTLVGLIILLVLILSVSNYVAQAAISLPTSTVDTNTKLTVTPSLLGDTTWYYDGLTDIVNNQTGQSFGKAYRYRSSNGNKMTMVNPGSVGDWANAFGGDQSYVIDQVTGGSSTLYSFQPPSPKSNFERYLITDVIEASGMNYTDSGTTIRVSTTNAPKVSKFKVRETASSNGCYKLNSTINIDFSVTEYDPTQNKFEKIQIYSIYEGASNAYLVEEFINKSSSNGVFSDSVSFKLERNEPVDFYIRAYDGLNRIDQDSSSLNNTVGSYNPFGLKVSACTTYESGNDNQPIPTYDFTSNTLLQTSLDTGFFGRANESMRAYPSGNSMWYGPVRYPTIYNGHPDDGGTQSGDNSNMTKHGANSTSDSITAYDFPFIYLSGPINSSVAKPGQPIHNSQTSTTFNVQQTSAFSESTITTLFNGNPKYVLGTGTKKNTITSGSKSFGTYYWIRDLAESSGGDVGNVNRNGQNSTQLEIYRTDFPDIELFEASSTNSFKPNVAVKFNFNGFEYVSDTRTGQMRNQVNWDITIVNGPEKGKEISSVVSSNKSSNNPKKTGMKRYDGKFQNNSVAQFTPKEVGKYTLQLTVTDTVKRTTKSELIAFNIATTGGGITTPDKPDIEEPEEPEYEGPMPEVTIYGPTKIKAGEEIGLFAAASVEGGTIDRYIWDHPGSDGGEPNDRNLEKLYYMTVGEKYTSVAVEDNNNHWAFDDHLIEVLPPTPVASIRIGGTSKQNRKAILDGSSSYSPKYFPIVWSKSYIEVTPKGGQNASTIKYSGSLTGIQQKDILFKEPGLYEAKIYVENEAGLSDSSTITFTIAPDLPPVANFNMETKVYRDAKDSNNASISLSIPLGYDESKDNDFIKQRIWKYRYDSDNDGNYTEENWVILDQTNKTSVLFKSKDVGRYEFHLEIVEEFGQPTILEYIVPSDYRRDDTNDKDLSEKLLLIDNRAPSVQWGP